MKWFTEVFLHGPALTSGEFQLAGWVGLAVCIDAVVVVFTVIPLCSYGGNLLLNIGPTADGRVPPVVEERLRQMGSWLKVNGEAVYGTHVWHTRQDPNNNMVL